MIMKLMWRHHSTFLHLYCVIQALSLLSDAGMKTLALVKDRWSSLLNTFLPNLPTGLMPLPVYQDASMSGSARHRKWRIFDWRLRMIHFTHITWFNNDNILSQKQSKTHSWWSRRRLGVYRPELDSAAAKHSRGSHTASSQLHLQQEAQRKGATLWITSWFHSLTVACIIHLQSSWMMRNVPGQQMYEVKSKKIHLESHDHRRIK